jgi:hypothetical protein
MIFHIVIFKNFLSLSLKLFRSDVMAKEEENLKDTKYLPILIYELATDNEYTTFSPLFYVVYDTLADLQTISKTIMLLYLYAALAYICNVVNVKN